MSFPEETWSGREWLMPPCGVNAVDDDVKSGARSTDEMCTSRPQQEVDLVMVQVVSIGRKWNVRRGFTLALMRGGRTDFR